MTWVVGAICQRRGIRISIGLLAPRLTLALLAVDVAADLLFEPPEVLYVQAVVNFGALWWLHFGKARANLTLSRVESARRVRVAAEPAAINLSQLAILSE